ncbi:hypothetical protein RyT2_28520 [Pseudolactococcus yaeyamensis]
MNRTEQIVYNALIDELIDDETKQIKESMRGISKSGFQKILTQNIKTYQAEKLDISEDESQKLVALNHLSEDDFEQLKTELLTCYAIV